MKKSVTSALLFLSSLAPFSAQAVSIHLDVEAPSGSLYTSTLDVTPCAVTNDLATTSVSAKCALEQAGLDPQWSNYGGDDWFLTALGSTTQDFAKNLYWNWWSGLTYGQTALNKHDLADGESLLITLGLLPLRIDVPAAAITTGATTSIMVEEFGFDASYNGVWAPSASTTVAVGDTAYETDSLGNIYVVASTTDPLMLTASKPNFVSASLTVTPVSPAPVTPATSTPPEVQPIAISSGGGGSPVPAQFNVSNALAYLAGQELVDGSYEAPFLSDWAAIAFTAGGQSSRLRDYMSSATPALSSVTDYERHAMALEALGISPYTGTATDYVAPIVHAFDGAQVGDTYLDNDDVFAILPLLAAGYNSSDAIISRTVASIVSAQRDNGSWDASPDMTAAAIQALTPVAELPGVAATLSRATNYLHSAQQGNGGFGNSFTTSWALQAVSALGDSPRAWALNSLTPLDALIASQQPDGGVETLSTSAQTRVWATAYAIPAALGRPWFTLLQAFPKPVSQGDTGAGQVLGVSIAATSTPAVATSTPVVATSTLAAIISSPTASTTFLISAEAMVSAVNRARSQTLSTGRAGQTLAASSSTDQAVGGAAQRTGTWGRLWGAVAAFFSNIL